MPNAVNVAPGQVFARLTVLREGERRVFPSRPTGARTMWCRCECGNEVNVLLSSLASSGARSCGCQCLAQPVAVRPGDRYGRLTILQETPRRVTAGRARGVRAFQCRCDCGQERTVVLTSLRTGSTRSCGCLNSENHRSPENLKRLAAGALRASTTHGLRHHPLYDTWRNMMYRCYRPRTAGFKYYGGRGITVCADWHDVGKFIAWMEANLGLRPDGVTASGHPEYSLDRINPDGHYEPLNVRWADWETQLSNRRTPGRC